MAALLAVLAALGFAGSAVSSKRGVQQTSTLGGFVVSLPAGLAVAVAFATLDPPSAVPPRALGLLALGGFLATGIGRVLVIGGLRRLDTSVHVPVQTSIHPLVGVLGGWLLFSERITLVRGTGVVAVVVGIWVLTRTRSTPPLVEPAESSLNHSRARAPSALALLFPVGAGLAFGGGDVVIKDAMLTLPHPAFGAAVATSVSCIGWGTIVTVSPRIRRQVRFGPGSRWFVLSGVLTMAAIICAYAALGRGDVSMVSPIIAAQPFAALVLSVLFLRRIETVTRQAMLGATIIVAGSVLVSIS